MKCLFYLGSSLLLASPALAQNAANEVVVADRIREDLITVVGTGSDQRVDESGQSIAVVGVDEIRSVQGPDLTRVLERLPGVTFSRNGGLGSFTALHVRGAASEQLLVLVDGIRMNDVASPAAGYDLGNLLTGGIGKIELLRGSNSVVWGSQAIGGVLAVTSRELNGVEASAEYGSRQSWDGAVSAGVATNRYAVSLDGGYSRTDGISAAASGTEPDGYRQWRIGGRARLALTDSLSLIANGRYADNRLGIDGYPPPSYFVFADTDDVQRTREASGLAGLKYRSDALSLTADYAISDIRRDYSGSSYAFSPYATRGQTQRAELSGSWTVTGPLRLDFGADNQWSRFSDTYDSRQTDRLTSGHALLGWYGDRFTLAAGVRIDDHSRFGSQWTFGANGSYRVVGNLRLRASYGEGFKVPTLYQLFSNYGKTTLVPEKSRSYDAGLEYGDRNGPLHAALTLFRRDSRNLIDFASCYLSSNPYCATHPYGYYDNVGSARAQGFEVELGAAITPTLRAGAAYSYVEATDRTPGGANNGNDLARRPRHAITASLDWISPTDGPLHGFALGADIRMVGNSYDNASNFTRLKGYELVTVRASVPLTDHVEIYGRVENLADVRYGTAAGYGTAGRSGFVGARARF